MIRWKLPLLCSHSSSHSTLTTSNDVLITLIVYLQRRTMKDPLTIGMRMLILGNIRFSSNDKREVNLFCINPSWLKCIWQFLDL